MKNIEKHLEIPHRETITGYNTLQTKPFDYQKTENMNNKKQNAVEWLVQYLTDRVEQDLKAGMTPSMGESSAEIIEGLKFRIKELEDELHDEKEFRRELLRKISALSSQTINLK